MKLVNTVIILLTLIDRKPYVDTSSGISFRQDREFFLDKTKQYLWERNFTRKMIFYSTYSHLKYGCLVISCFA